MFLPGVEGRGLRSRGDLGGAVVGGKDVLMASLRLMVEEEGIMTGVGLVCLCRECRACRDVLTADRGDNAFCPWSQCVNYHLLLLPYLCIYYVG